MLKFKALLIVFILSISIYTTIVVFNNGWNLFPIFFGEIISMTWSGQFNFDFTLFLMLSALWVAWRNKFNTIGICLGLLTLIGGMLFFAAYLLVLCFRIETSVKELLLGKN